MEEIEVNTIEINGKEYILLDTIENEGNKYYYLYGMNDNKNIQILKAYKENNEEGYMSVDDESEFNEALAIYYLKHRDDKLEETTN